MLVGLARPAHGPLHRFAGVFVADGILGTFVEGHQNIAAEGKLRVDGRFRGEGVQIAVEMRAEHHAVLGDAAQAAQAENLEAAGIGEDGAAATT